jgi:hypothetical protein
MPSQLRQQPIEDGSDALLRIRPLSGKEGCGGLAHPDSGSVRSVAGVLRSGRHGSWDKGTASSPSDTEQDVSGRASAQQFCIRPNPI